MQFIAIKLFFRQQIHSRKKLLKPFLIMKFSFLFLFAAALQVHARTAAQNVTIRVKEAKLSDVFQKIRKQTGYNFFYNESMLKSARSVTINLKEQPLQTALKQCFAGQPFSYEILDKIIIVKEEETISSVAQIIRAAQNIHGIVTDTAGHPVSGASVFNKNSAKGTFTNTSGGYTIDANPGDVLQFSYVGYQTQSITVRGEEINVSLVAVPASLNDIVVVGYGTQKKVDLTGSIATVGTKQLENRPVTNVTNALEGTMPGVTIVQNNGQPGHDAGTINIRGIGTLNGGTDPMIVVDGNIASSMNSVDPNDIATISVLKDAAAAAIYGSRAANGVILITTKKGKAGTAQISYNDYFGKQKATALPQFLPSWQAATLYNEALENEGHAVQYTDAEIDSFRIGNSPYNYPNTDWLGLFYSGSGFQQSHNLNVSGGSDKTQYFFSLGYFDENGIVPKTNTQRYNTRLNITSKIADHLTVFGNLSYTYQPVMQPQSSYPGVPAFSQMIRQINRISNMIPYKYANGNYGYISDGSPMAWLNSSSFDKNESNVFIGIAGADWEPIKNLHIRPQIAYTANTVDDRNFIAAIQYYNSTGAPTMYQQPNNASETYQKTTIFTPQLLVDYSWKLGNDNHFKVLGGYSQELDDWHELYGYRQNFLNNDITVINAGSTTGQVGQGDANQLALRSYFGRFNYDYKERYLFEANLRYDGSSRFIGDNRYGTFPSLSAGWRISEEKFFQPLKNIVNNLKLRGSWGRLGNQTTSYGGVIYYYPAISALSTGQNYVFGGTSPAAAPGVALTEGIDSSIHWETTTESNFGLDADFLHNTLNITVDYFIKNTSGILYQLPVAASYGLTAPYINAASVRNQGLELELSYHSSAGKLQYNISGNAAFIKNKITSLAGTGDVISGATIKRVGLPINAYYGYVSQGVFQSQSQISAHADQSGISPNIAPGDLMYKDISGPNGKPDGVIDSYDKTYLGTNFPKITYGININLEYEGFDLIAFFQGAAGVKNFTQGSLLGQNSNAAGKPTSILLNSWTADHPTNFPRAWINYQQNDPSDNPSSFWIKSAAYLRMKNLQIGYSLPDKWAKSIHVQKLRVYYSGQNLFTITQFYKWVDPEAPSGTSGYDYPQVKINTLGLNITF